MLFLLHSFCSLSDIFSSSKNLYTFSEIILVKSFHLNGKQKMIIVHCITFSSISLAQNRLSISQPIRQLFISIQNLIQSKSSSFMQVCQFLTPETLNSISSRSFPIRDFPTLLRNHLRSNNHTLLLLIVIFFLHFFQPLCISIMFFTFTQYVTLKHSTLI